MSMQFYARKIEVKEQLIYQYLSEHLDNTARYCQSFVCKFSDDKIGAFMGLLHDIGKYSPSFQRRIRGANIKVAHAWAGAQECEKRYHGQNRDFVYRLLGMAICGHHSGLMDYTGNNTSYRRRLETAGEGYDDWQLERAVPELSDLNCLGIQELRPREDCDDKTYQCHGLQLAGFTVQFYGRFLFSALVDADRLDAQDFPDGDAKRRLAACRPLEVLEPLFNAYMEKLRGGAMATPLNVTRNMILENCITAAAWQPGLFSLTVPTGGGKTLASMAFALEQARRYQKERIIYAIPFTSIIEQNAAVFAKIFGADNVLEHHSNFELPTKRDEDGENDSERLRKLKFAQENWCEPLIVTTNVQFFETMFSDRPSKARKLHNIANSVIILDEVQSIPIQYMKPCMAALHELTANYHCSVVLCTATQPEFDRNRLFLSDVAVREIIADVPALFAKLRRTKEFFLGGQTVAEIAARLQEQQQALCIVNTKRHARAVFDALGGGAEGNFHLSTNMYPRHRQAVLAAIRQRLEKGESCRVVSTQLIEAGVDIDFPMVFRSLAGIDSIIQAAGRCNREGKLPEGQVYAFVPEEEYQGKGYLKMTADIGGLVIGQHDRFLDNAAVRAYFKQLFDIGEQKTDEQNIMDLCAEVVEDMGNIQVPYETISRKFKFIENEGIPLVILANDEVENLLTRAEYANSLGGILRQLSTYTVNVKPYELEKLAQRGGCKLVAESIAVLVDKHLYSEDCGLILETTDEAEDYIV